MKYVQTHLTKHHLFHAPHRWFFALILSPIHAAEMHYERRYHLSYAHAKVLFGFDMALLGSIFLLLFGTIFWFTYDPTVTNDIRLTLSPRLHDKSTNSPRIRSGEHIDYVITYANKSDVLLQEPKLIVAFPDTFILEKTEPADNFTPTLHSFNLPDLLPEANGQVVVSGFFWGTPGHEERVAARLSYRQEQRASREEKASAILTTLRGSVVETIFTAPNTAVDNGIVETTLSIKNNSHHPVSGFKILVPSNETADVIDTDTALGAFAEKLWTLPELAPDASATAMVRLRMRASSKDSIPLEVQPEVIVSGQTILLEKRLANVNLLHPAVTAHAVWDNETPLHPGDARTLTLILKNTGVIDLNNLSIHLQFPAGVVSGGDARTLRPSAYANLQLLKRGNDTALTIPVTTLTNIASGTDILLQPTITLTANTSGGAYTLVIPTPGIQVGTTLSVSGQIRYYTAEGDQLGRGPLPPQIGKETKYAALIYVTPGTSAVRPMTLTVTLAPGFSFTGKKSLSHGREVVYNSGNRTITWNVPELPAHEIGALYLELSFTPTANQAGTTPTVIQSIRAVGTDAFIGGQVSAQSGMLDISLTEDKKGQSKGVIVQ